MTCRKLTKWLSARFDGELDQAREQAVKEHLAGCPGCQRFAGDLPRSARALDLITVPEPRSGFTARVLARLPEPPRRRAGLRGWFEALRPGSAVAAALALSCGVVLALWMNGERGAQAANRDEPAEAAYADLFDALPGDSAGTRYLALLQEGEK